MGFALSALALSAGAVIGWHEHTNPYTPGARLWLQVVAGCLLAAGALGLALSFALRERFGGPVGVGEDEPGEAER